MSLMRVRDEAREGPPPIEGELRELVRRRLPRPETGSETGVSETGMNSLSSVIERVAGTSVLEIEKVITDLQILRERLQNEAQRVQREVIEYAQMSYAATRSTEIIAESLAQWKQTADSNRSARVAGG